MINLYKLGEALIAIKDDWDTYVWSPSTRLWVQVCSTAYTVKMHGQLIANNYQPRNANVHRNRLVSNTLHVASARPTQNH